MTDGWSDVDSIDIESINSDIAPAVPTADVAIYYPGNLDVAHAAKVTLDLPDYATDGFYCDGIYEGISMEIEPPAD